jgi:hypothetical protein
VVQIDSIVDDVDAADVPHCRIASQQLLMQAPQLARLKPGVPAIDRTKDGQRHGAAIEPAPQRGHAGPGAEAVDDDANAHAAPGCSDQRLGHGAARGVVMKNVSCEPHLALREGDGIAHRREQLVAAGEQPDLVAAAECGVAGRWPRPHVIVFHGHSNSATKGRWSLIRAQFAPRGTKVERQASTRV